MTTATLPEETGDSITAMAAVFEDRWSQLLQDVERYRAREGYIALNTVNSKRYHRISKTLDELAWRLLGELSDPEVDALLPVTEAIWEEIKQRLVSFALDVHATRERYRREHIEPARIATQAPTTGVSLSPVENFAMRKRVPHLRPFRER